jgi:parallel beta-helix repeat protein
MRVVVSGITFVHFSPPNQGSGIFNLAAGSSDFILEGCDIADNAGTPVVVGNRTRVVNNSIHDNHWVGIQGYRIGQAVIDHNEIYRNYLAGTSPDTVTGDASGLKFVETTAVSVTSNYIHDNHGVGVWFDTDNTATLIDGNVIADNTHRGIMDETSYGAIISNNTLTGNGRLSGWIAGAGIFIATSSNIEICSNVVAGNYQGITGFQQRRGAGSLGLHVTSHASIHDNYITMSRGVTGLTGGAENNPTNLFSGNHYCLTDAAGFIWGGKIDVSGWQRMGQDSGGSFSCGF